MEQTQEKNNGSFQGPDTQATHSGWNYFYIALGKYRDHCIALGKNVLGNDLNSAVISLSDYHAVLYSMAQQVFSFFPHEVEEQITNEWLDLGEKVNDFLTKINDRDFKRQMVFEGQGLDRELKVGLLKFFNKIDRMAAEAGLLVGHENKNMTEPKKGLIGMNKK